MKHLLKSISLMTLAATSFAFSKPDPTASVEKDLPRIQIALLLDTSSSMDGLIRQAQSQLWAIINACDTARKKGKAPHVEVALYQYGNDSLPKSEDWIQMVRPFSQDLDTLSESLFSLTTNGGTEYCAATIKNSLENLKWDTDPSTYRAIFIAGNESFTQGETSHMKVTKALKEKGIILNAIHCGGVEQGATDHWNDMGPLTAGGYFSIDQNKTEVTIETPFDTQLAELNTQLNQTYLAYGKGGIASQNKQQKADEASKRAGGSSYYSRAKTKTSANYDNGNWDLIDACKDEQFDIKKVETKHLPKELQGLTPDEQIAFIQALRLKREDIQKKINVLSVKRTEFIAEKRKELSEKDNGLNDVIVAALQEQLVKKGFTTK